MSRPTITTSPGQENKPKENKPKDQPLTRASTTFYDRFVTDWWWWELLSWTVSFACVAAIVGVLWYHDGKRQPEYLVTGITLNAYVSVFAAVSKAALLLPVSEAIGQLKWVWFQKRTALWDFQLFDAASRGPWGATMLLIKTRCKHLVSLAALITILGLAFEPFFQQIVTYPDRMVPAGGGLTWAASTFVPQFSLLTRRASFGNNDRDPAMTLAIDTVFDTPDIDMRPSMAQCSTANCTWPTYATLGVGHTCQDVSYLLQYICENHTHLDLPQQAVLATDPCGYRVNNTFVIGISGNLGFRDVISLSTVLVDTLDMPNSGATYWNSTVFSNSTLPILDFYIAYTPGGPEAALKNQTPVLLECLLTWNVHIIDSRIANGVLQEKVLDTVVIQPQSLDNDTAWPITASFGSNSTFQILNGSTQLLRDWIMSDLPFYLDQDPAYDFELYAGIWKFHQIAPYDFGGHLSNLTKAITNDMKSRSSGTMPIEGIAWSSERFVEIRWAWIALPATSLVGSLALILATIVRGKKTKAPVWKSSSLATLLHGLTEETRNRIDQSSSSSQIEAMSKKLRVRLSSQDGSVRLRA